MTLRLGHFWQTLELAIHPLLVKHWVELDSVPKGVRCRFHFLSCQSRFEASELHR